MKTENLDRTYFIGWFKERTGLDLDESKLDHRNFIDGFCNGMTVNVKSDGHGKLVGAPTSTMKTTHTHGAEYEDTLCEACGTCAVCGACGICAICGAPDGEDLESYENDAAPTRWESPGE